MTSQEKNAYLAGIVDGEGTITIFNHQQYKRKTKQYKPCISIANTDENLMIYISKNYSEKYHVLRYEGEKNKTCYVWMIRSLDNIQNILDRIMPYLIIKKQHAKILYKYIMTRKKVRLYNKNAPYSEIEYKCYKKIKKLNERKHERKRKNL